MAFKKKCGGYAATIFYYLPKRQINNKLIEFLFCDTTNGKAVGTIPVVIVYKTTTEVEDVSIDAKLCTTPVGTEATTAVERAIGGVAVASSRQGQ